MTNSLALIAGALLIGALISDRFIFDGMVTVFLGKKFLDLTEYLAIWR